MQKIMTGFKNPCYTENDKVYNLKKVLKGLAAINLKHHMNDVYDFLRFGNQRDLALFC